MHLLITITLVSFVFSHQSNAQLSYSFPLPLKYGSLELEDANCCEFFTYPKNDTSEATHTYPTFIGLGVKKSGTTSIYAYLSQHPNFVKPCIKEIHFLSSDKAYLEMSDYLHELNPEASNHTNRHLIFEITPVYLYIPMAACRAKYLFPNMKFLVVMREPVSRTYSHFNFERIYCYASPNANEDFCNKKFDYNNSMSIGIQNMKDKECTFNTGIAKKSWNDCYRCITQNIKTRAICHVFKSRVLRPVEEAMSEDEYEMVQIGESLISMSIYAPQIAWWFHFFQPDQFFFINSESFDTDPVSIFQQILHFIDYEDYTSNKVLNLKKQNKANYPENKEPNYETVNNMLFEFFYRSSLELVQLLKATGHDYFEQYELFKEENDNYSQNEQNKYYEKHDNSIEVTFNLNDVNSLRIIRHEQINEWPSTRHFYLISFVVVACSLALLYRFFRFL